MYNLRIEIICTSKIIIEDFQRLDMIFNEADKYETSLNYNNLMKSHYQKKKSILAMKY